jgi:hypothetical protein
MNLAVWLPAMALLGFALFGIAELFRRACERI